MVAEKLEQTADNMSPRFDPNPEDPEGYLLNEFAAYLLLAQTLTPACCRWKEWIAKDLLAAVRPAAGNSRA